MINMFRTNTYAEYLPTNLSLTLEEMNELHIQMLKGISEDEDAMELYQTLLLQALRYFQFRVNWAVWDYEEKMSKDQSRTGCHNTLIANFNMLARYMKSLGISTEWRDILGDETEEPFARKRIGDFACYLVFVNAINER